MRSHRDLYWAVRFKLQSLYRRLELRCFIVYCALFHRWQRTKTAAAMPFVRARLWWLDFRAWFIKRREHAEWVRAVRAEVKRLSREPGGFWSGGNQRKERVRD